MFQDVAGIWKVLVREDFFMHQMEADAPNQVWVGGWVIYIVVD
jgi:hypothetical protein